MISAPDIRVCSAQQDQRDVGLRGAETPGYFGLGHRSFQAPDFGYFGWGQQLLESLDETRVDGMLLVSSVISPFEIGEDVVGLISINMIDERKTDRVWNERECDKAMDETSRSFAFSKQGDLHVTEFMKGGLENLSIASLWPMPCFSHPIDASDSSKVAHLVKSFEARNDSPLFFNHDVASLQLTRVADYSYAKSVVQ